MLAYEPGSYFYLQTPGVEQGPFDLPRKVSAITDDLNLDDQVYFLVSHYGSAKGKLANLYLTTPHGYVLKNPSFSIQFDSGGFSYHVGTVGQLLEVPGVWQMDIALDFKLLISRDIEVVGESNSKNKAPGATLNASFDGEGIYKFDFLVEDPEQDPVIISWYAPGQDPLINANPTFFVSPKPGEIMQVFAHVKDDINRDDPNTPEGSRSGDGFGALHSRYIAVPLSPGVPTYFADQKILHIPGLHIDGQTLRANFKLTQLSGVVFKFLEFDYVGAGSSDDLAFLDLTTGELQLSKLGVVDGAAYTEVDNIRFKLMPDSNPVKFILQ